MTQALVIPSYRLKKGQPPVVLLGGISLVRALGMAGIPVIVATHDDHEPALASRYCTGRCRLPAWSETDAVTETLLGLGATLARRLGEMPEWGKWGQTTKRRPTTVSLGVGLGSPTAVL